MDSTTVLWAPIKKELNKTDNGGTVNINNMGSYIVRKYVNEINYAYTYTQKNIHQQNLKVLVVYKTTQIKLLTI